MMPSERTRLEFLTRAANGTAQQRPPRPVLILQGRTGAVCWSEWFAATHSPPEPPPRPPVQDAGDFLQRVHPVLAELAKRAGAVPQTRPGVADRVRVDAAQIGGDEKTISQGRLPVPSRLPAAEGIVGTFLT